MDDNTAKRKGGNMMLTPKQEKFVRNLIDGMSQREAYKNSYDAENMSDKVIDNEASLLFNSREIAMRYKELQEQLANATIMTAIERLEYLTGIVKGTERDHGVSLTKDGVVEYDAPADLNTKIKAIDIMNKMQGEYVTKIEGDVRVRKLEDLI